MYFMRSSPFVFLFVPLRDGVSLVGRSRPRVLDIAETISFLQVANINYYVRLMVASDTRSDARQLDVGCAHSAKVPILVRFSSRSVFFPLLGNYRFTFEGEVLTFGWVP